MSTGSVSLALFLCIASRISLRKKRTEMIRKSIVPGFFASHHGTKPRKLETSWWHRYSRHRDGRRQRRPEEHGKGSQSAACTACWFGGWRVFGFWAAFSVIWVCLKLTEGLLATLMEENSMKPSGYRILILPKAQGSHLK